MTYLTGDTGGGKSVMALQIAYNVAANYGPVLVASNEILSPETTQRMVAWQAGVRGNLLKYGPAEELARGLPDIEIVMGRMSSTPHPLYMTDVTMDMMQIRQVVQKKVVEAGRDLALIVIDRLELLDDQVAGGRADEMERIVEISRRVKRLARDTRTHVLGVVQLRKMNDQNKRPTLDDLKGAAALKQDAQNVIAMWHPEAANFRPDESECEVHVLKCSTGKGGIVNMIFKGSTPAFYEKAVG